MEIRKDYPPHMQRISNVYNTAKDIVMDISVGHSIFVPEEIKNQRYDMCKQCEWFYSVSNMCKKCGCLLSAKTKFRSSFCPIHKWEQYDKDSDKPKQDNG